MKSKLYKLTWLLTCGLLISSCDNALDSNLPEEYASVVHFKGVEDEPETEMKLLLTGEDVIYEFEVGKGGNEPAAEANVDIKVMTEEELAAYNKEWNTDYILLPSEFYSFSETSLKFTSQENLKKVQITFKGATLQELADDGKQYVIPMTLSGVNTLVHEGLHQSILKLKISIPTINIDMPEIQNIEKSLYDNESDKKIEIPLTSIIDLNENKWTFNAILVNNRTILQQLVDEYKSLHTESYGYELIPEVNYTLPEYLIFDKSLLSTAIIKIDANGIEEEKNYLLPIKLEKCEGKPFNVDNKVFYIHLYIKDQLPQITITPEMMVNSFPTEDNEIGFNLSNLFDNNGGTFWKSKWSEGASSQKDNKYGVWLDIKLEKSINYFAFKYQTQASWIASNPKVIHIYAYNTIDQTFLIKELNNLPKNGNSWYTTENITLNETYSNFRICIMEDQNGKKQQPNVNGWVGFSELEIYGKP